ncbi:hypothetical protein BpHYR1_040129, partial [Brachionus plicatilis]
MSTETEESRTFTNGVENIKKCFPSSWQPELKKNLGEFFTTICVEVNALRSELSKAKAEIDALKKEKKSFSSLFQTSTDVSNEEKQEAKVQKTNVLSVFTDEIKEQERVSKNITIRGVEVYKGESREVSQKEEEKVENILDALGIRDLNIKGKTRRITKFDKK